MKTAQIIDAIEEQTRKIEGLRTHIATGTRYRDHTAKKSLERTIQARARLTRKLQQTTEGGAA